MDIVCLNLFVMRTYTQMQKSDACICNKIIISFDMEATGIVGGDYESEPSVHSWASFNPHRLVKSQKLDAVKLTSFQSVSHHMGALRGHKFSHTNAHSFLFGDSSGDNNKEKTPVEETDENVEFEMPVNHSVYRTLRPIVYDLSQGEFHAMDTLRTDASIWLKLMTISLYSGVPKIDENDRKFQKIRRDVQSGVCQIELCDLFRVAAQIKASKKGGSIIEDLSFPVTSEFVDPKLLNMAMAEQVEAYGKQGTSLTPDLEQQIRDYALNKTCKANLKIRVTLGAFNLQAYHNSRFSLPDLKTSPLNTLMNISNKRNAASAMPFSHRYDLKQQQHYVKKSFNPILVNSQPGIVQMRMNLEYVLQTYCNSFFPVTPGATSLYQPMNQNVKKLHLPMFISEQGITPVINYFSSHTPYTREYPNETMRQREKHLFDYNDETERHFEMMTRASLRRHGMSQSQFMKCIHEHYSHESRHEMTKGTFITALKVVADIGTFAANSAYYTADFRYYPVARNDSTVRYKKINIDSFDSTILNGTGNADDCEGQANVAIAILNAFSEGRLNYQGKWQSALLNSVKEVLDNHITFAVGATVTSAYVDNNNKPVDMKAENVNLPMIGDTMDINSRCDGHCFGVMIPIAVTDRLLENGNLDPDQLASLRQSWGVRQFKTRDYNTPMIVLEGTGSVEPTILPIDEVFDAQERAIERAQAHVVLGVMKGMKARLNEPSFVDKELVMDMFNGEGLEFYMEKQDPQRRVSRFYREFIHGVSCNLYDRLPILSQIAFSKRASDSYEYGVNTGELLRSGVTRSSDVALITPFKDSIVEWEERVVPMTESIQNQMPIMAFGHYNDTAATCYSRFMAMQGSSSESTTTTHATALSKHDFEALIETVSGNDKLAVVRLQSREWKLQDASRVEKLTRFIEETPGLVAYAFFSEKHLRNCDALVDILLVVDATK